MHYSFTARLTIAICTWLLARAGVKWKLEQPRDKQGRFKPKDGGGYGFPKSIPHKVADLMHDLGVTKQMYDSAVVPLVLPDDLEDIPALEECLRLWVLHNMDHWVHGCNRNPYSVIRCLMYTWAIDLCRYQPPKRMLAWWLRNVANVELPVRAELASARSVAGHRSEPFQGVGDFKLAKAIQDTPTCAQPGELGSPTAPDQATRRMAAEMPPPLSQSLERQSGPDPPWYSPPPHPPPSPPRHLENLYN